MRFTTESVALLLVTLTQVHVNEGFDYPPAVSCPNECILLLCETRNPNIYSQQRYTSRCGSCWSIVMSSRYSSQASMKMFVTSKCQRSCVLDLIEMSSGNTALYTKDLSSCGSCWASIYNSRESTQLMSMTRSKIIVEGLMKRFPVQDRISGGSSDGKKGGVLIEIDTDDKDRQQTESNDHGMEGYLRARLEHEAVQYHSSASANNVIQGGGSPQFWGSDDQSSVHSGHMMGGGNMAANSMHASSMYGMGGSNVGMHSQQASQLGMHAQQESQLGIHAQQGSQMGMHAQQASQMGIHAQQASQVGMHAQQASQMGIHAQQASQVGMHAQQASQLGIHAQQASQVGIHAQQASQVGIHAQQASQVGIHAQKESYMGMHAQQESHLGVQSQQENHASSIQGSSSHEVMAGMHSQSQHTAQHQVGMGVGGQAATSVYGHVAGMHAHSSHASSAHVVQNHLDQSGSQSSQGLVQGIQSEVHGGSSEIIKEQQQEVKAEAAIQAVHKEETQLEEKQESVTHVQQEIKAEEAVAESMNEEESVSGEQQINESSEHFEELNTAINQEQSSHVNHSFSSENVVCFCKIKNSAETVQATMMSEANFQHQHSFSSKWTNPFYSYEGPNYPFSETAPLDYVFSANIGKISNFGSSLCSVLSKYKKVLLKIFGRQQFFKLNSIIKTEAKLVLKEFSALEPLKSCNTPKYNEYSYLLKGCIVRISRCMVDDIHNMLGDLLLTYSKLSPGSSFTSASSFISSFEQKVFSCGNKYLTDKIRGKEIKCGLSNQFGF